MNKTNLKLNMHHTIVLNPLVNLNELLTSVESELLRLAMQRCKRNQSLCAKGLGISRGTLRTKLKRYFGNEYFRDSI